MFLGWKEERVRGAMAVPFDSFQSSTQNDWYVTVGRTGRVDSYFGETGPDRLLQGFIRPSARSDRTRNSKLINGAMEKTKTEVAGLKASNANKYWVRSHATSPEFSIRRG